MYTNSGGCIVTNAHSVLPSCPEFLYGIFGEEKRNILDEKKSGSVLEDGINSVYLFRKSVASSQDTSRTNPAWLKCDLGVERKRLRPD